VSEIRYVCRRTDNCRCAECEVQWLNKRVESLRAALAEAERDRLAERESAFDRQLTEVAALLAPTTHHSNVIEAVRDVLAERGRLREALREIATHPCWLVRGGWRGTCIDMNAAGPCGPCAARAFLARLDGEVEL